MPTYEYRCKDCGHEFEAVQAFTDDPLQRCPECEGPIRKLFGAVGISFKGSGFYKTDSRSGGSSSKSSTSASSSGSNAGDTTSGGSAANDGGSSGSSGSSGDSGASKPTPAAATSGSSTGD